MVIDDKVLHHECPNAQRGCQSWYSFSWVMCQHWQCMLWPIG